MTDYQERAVYVEDEAGVKKLDRLLEEDGFRFFAVIPLERGRCFLLAKGQRPEYHADPADRWRDGYSDN